MSFLDDVYLGNRLLTWLFVLLVFVVLTSVFAYAKRLLIRQLSGLAGHTRSAVDDAFLAVLTTTRGFFLAIIAFYIAVALVAPPADVVRPIRIATVMLALIQVGLWGNSFIHHWISRYAGADGGRATTVSALGFIGRLVLWSFLALAGLQNVGINVSALIAGLGIGGIAVALAVQNILGDLFASLSIILDKPFVLGDLIAVDSFMGNVEYIGLKTTRVRSLFGEEIVFSNADLLKSRLRNYRRMRERRVVFTVSVTYENPYENLRAVPGLIKEVVDAQPHARFERAHFKQYRDFALDFEVVYFVDGHDYNIYMDVQQDINLGIFRRFHERGIEFAHQGTAHTQQLPVAAQEGRS